MGYGSTNVPSKGLDTSDATLDSGARMLSGYTAYANGIKYTGTIVNRGSRTFTPSTSSQSASSGYYSSIRVNAVTKSIDSNIKAENIKENVTILGVTGTLEEGIDTSDATATASDIVKGKTAYSNGNKLTGTFAGEELNVFVQGEEPAKKDGVWIKLPNGPSYIQLTDIPYENGLDFGGATNVNNNIYLFAAYNKNTTTYKYDTLTDTYTQLASMDINTPGGCRATKVSDNDIYLIYNLSGAIYKYNISANTYTQLKAIPIMPYYSAFINIGTNIYIFGSYMDWDAQYAYKYDTLTDTYTKLADFPYKLYYGATATIGTDIYLFGNGNSAYSTYAYKYDTLKDTYTKLADIPNNFNQGGTATTVGTDIYLFGGTNAYKYNTLTDEYTLLENIPYNFYRGAAAIVDTSIYLFGDNNNSKNAYKYVLSTKIVPEGVEMSANNIGEVGKYIQLTNIPYNFYAGDVASIGSNIYLFGGFEGTGKEAYKYNISTNTYTKLTNHPSAFYYGKVATINTYVYLFSRSGLYKYDTTTDTYTRLSNIPYSFDTGSTAVVGTDIYLFGGIDAEEINYKYDTLTDTYTQMTNIPYGFYDGSTAAVGTDIYLFGSEENSKNTYKYDTLTDTYTQLTNIPYSFASGAVAIINTDIYILGGNYSSTNVYKYNTLTDTYTKLASIPYYFYYGSATAINTDIYLFGSENSSFYTTAYKYLVRAIKKPQNNYAYILTNGVITAKLSNLLKTTLQYAYLCENETLSDYPCYYGDGTNWNLIEI